jgi:hypothetical protein
MRRHILAFQISSMQETLIPRFDYTLLIFLDWVLEIICLAVMGDWCTGVSRRFKELVASGFVAACVELLPYDKDRAPYPSHEILIAEVLFSRFPLAWNVLRIKVLFGCHDSGGWDFSPSRRAVAGGLPQLCLPKLPHRLHILSVRSVVGWPTESISKVVYRCGVVWILTGLWWQCFQRSPLMFNKGYYMPLVSLDCVLD